MAAESAVAQIPAVAQLEKINPRSIRHIRVFSRYATGMKGIRDAIIHNMIVEACPLLLLTFYLFLLTSSAQLDKQDFDGGGGMDLFIEKIYKI